MLIHLYLEVGVEPTRGGLHRSCDFAATAKRDGKHAASRLATLSLNGFATSPTMGCFAGTGVNTMRQRLQKLGTAAGHGSLALDGAEHSAPILICRFG